MKISRPVITESNGEIRVSARVDIRYNRCEFPDTLWFKFPASYRDDVSDRADGFAAGLLPLAMTLKEDLEIHGPISPRLLRGIHDYQNVQHACQPGLLQVVDVRCDTLERQDPDAVSGAVGCTFSGGIDSMYTLMNHIPQNEPNPAYRLTHALMINGFDLDTDLEHIGESYKPMQFYRPMMDRFGVRLLVSTTNIMQFLDYGILMSGFGAVLTSSAMVLGRLFSRFSLASAEHFTHFSFIGSHFLLDHLLSTETLDVIHDAPTVSRIDKTLRLAKRPQTYAALRVCHREVDFAKASGGIENCCRCEKCIRTMAALKIAGKLDAYGVFPKPLRRRDIWKSRYIDPFLRVYARDIIAGALRTGNMALAFDFIVALVISGFRHAAAHPVRMLHLAIEQRSDRYRRCVERHHPGFKRGMRRVLRPR